MERSAVGIGVDRDRTNTHFAKRADNTKRDLTAVGDQDTGEH